MLRCPSCNGTKWTVYQRVLIKYPADDTQDYFNEEHEFVDFERSDDEPICYDCGGKMLDDGEEEWENYFKEEAEDGN